MRIASEGRRRAVVCSVLVLLATSTSLAACTGGDGSCERGAIGAERAVSELLTAVAADDRPAAENLLSAGFEVEPSAFDLLHQELDGITVDSLLMSGDQMGSRHAVRVTAPDAGLVGTFEVEENSDTGCAAVAWGTAPSDEVPAPGDSAPASP